MKKLLFFIFILLLFSCKKESIMTSDNYYYKRARICRESKNTDSAFYYYNLAKNEYLKINDSLGVGNSLVNMALIQTNKGDFYGGIESSFEANKFLRRENDSIFRNRLATNYNNIGLSYYFLKDFGKSSSFYIKALKYIDPEENKLLCYNNIGDVLINQQKYSLAKKFLEKAVFADSANNYSRALNNLAKAKYLDDKNYNPLSEFNKALAIRQQINDGEGLNSSFETLSTYYLDRNEKLSLHYAQEMLNEAVNNESPDDQITALKRIITLDSKNYLKNFQKLDSIDNNVQISRNKHKSQFAVVRYDVEQKNAQNQILTNKNIQQNFGLVALALALIISFFWYRKRQIRLKQEKELEVKNTQLKMSKKVHDVVANGIYQVMTKIENQEHFDRDKALDELEYVYEKSRDLSYEKAGEEKEFSQEISDLIASFTNATVKTFTAGNNPSIWENISPAVKEEIYQMVRELMVNMKKHSQASHVALKFEKIKSTVEIQYKDNGVGISGDLIYKNGLRNTASRIEAIGGTITFDTKIEKGLKVNLSFPCS